MKSLLKNWNILDQIFYMFESKVKEKKEEAAAPDPETMIEAVTKQLQEENASLKKLQYPKPIICREGNYYCPHCEMELEQTLVKEYRIKYCIECGTRLILPPK